MCVCGKKHPFLKREIKRAPVNTSVERGVLWVFSLLMFSLPLIEPIYSFAAVGSICWQGLFKH